MMLYSGCMLLGEGCNGVTECACFLPAVLVGGAQGMEIFRKLEDFLMKSEDK